MKSLRTALSLYALFSGNQRDWGVGELAEATELTKSRVSKVLAAFRDAGLLRQDPVTRRYQVDRRAFVIGSRFLVHDPLSREALPIMRELGSATGHSARLSIRDGDDLIYLLTLEGPHFVDTGWRAGAILPWHATTAGRVLLAYMSDVEREALLGAGPLEKLTERTVTDRRELARILASVRRDGFSSARGESTAGLGAIAAPVLGPDQKVCAALGLAFPEHLVSASNQAKLATALCSAAAKLSQRNGSPVYSLPGVAEARAPTAKRLPSPVRERGRG